MLRSAHADRTCACQSLNSVEEGERESLGSGAEEEEEEEVSRDTDVSPLAADIIRLITCQKG